ncbi:DNA polymerase/3'-5' exonuclease PolX [Falsibacillus pallidus]|uniref:DNA polymerase beta n=1 Tax=Falsibacillus pallidus TaxID=493781 RepID=A0A370GQG8_9BACI|nr:DNA polymerase/3'-5' exonuclease PolX [Falsibacillus pallidus]RDI44213.1 DNA polymerase (family 10) [Falsibacillus pallidus]
MNKKDVIRLLEHIAIYMELKGENTFKVAAFRKAAAALEGDDRSLKDITDFQSLSGIGKGTAAVIEEFIESGTSSVLDELKKEVPSGLIPLLQLQGLGGKKIAKLYQELGVVDMETLKAACEEGKVKELAGFGKKTEEKILEAISQSGKRPDRLPLAYMLPIAEKLEKHLRDMDGIIRFSRAGSIRRLRETIKDLDFIIATENPQKVKEHLMSLPDIKESIANGMTKVSLTFEWDYDISVDFRLVEPKEFATALHHFTGSKDHNVRMRQLAKDRGEKISEYGVENAETGEILTFESEKDFFAHFNLPFIPPEIREDGSEVELFKSEDSIVSLENIKGDLHMHSTWSDGAFSIEEMVDACREKGYEYMAITDHSQYLKVANGLTEERVRKQMQEIRSLNEKYDDITILSGIEMDILPDATLDYSDELLQELDIVIASIHSSFSQSKGKIMERLKTALVNNHVDIIAHPTGRLIGRREGYPVDMDMLIELAKETKTALELNANPNRLDLSSENIAKAQKSGVKIVINTDAHNKDNLKFMELGVAAARKGGIAPENILNTYSKDQLMAFLKRHDTE